MGLIYAIGDSASGLYRPPPNAASDAKNGGDTTQPQKTTTNDESDQTEKKVSEEEPTEKTTESKDTSSEQRALVALKSRDREVHAHEAAHIAAGGSLTGPASFSYEVGTDGKRYAVGGEVSIDTSPVSGDPQATIMKANRIRAAALAPASPSAQDQSVASGASAMAAEARVAALREQQNRSEENESTKPTTNTTSSDDKQTSQIDSDPNTQDTAPATLVAATSKPTPESLKGKLLDTFA